MTNKGANYGSVSMRGVAASHRGKKKQHLLYWCIVASASIIDEPNWESKPSATAPTVALASQSHLILILM